MIPCQPEGDKSWGIGHALFAITKSCHYGRSNCRSLRFIIFLRFYPLFTRYIFSFSKVTGVKMPRLEMNSAEISNISNISNKRALYKEDVHWNQYSSECMHFKLTRGSTF